MAAKLGNSRASGGQTLVSRKGAKAQRKKVQRVAGFVFLCVSVPLREMSVYVSSADADHWVFSCQQHFPLFPTYPKTTADVAPSTRCNAATAAIAEAKQARPFKRRPRTGKHPVFPRSSSI